MPASRRRGAGNTLLFGHKAPRGGGADSEPPKDPVVVLPPDSAAQHGVCLQNRVPEAGDGPEQVHSPGPKHHTNDSWDSTWFRVQTSRVSMQKVDQVIFLGDLPIQPAPCQVLVWNHMPTNPPRVSQKGGWCALHDPAEKCGHKQLLYSRWTLMTPASIWLRSAPIAPHFGRRDAHRRADRRPRQPWRRCRWRHRQRAWPGTSVVSRKNMSRETTWEGRNGPGLQLTALNESVNPRRDPRPAIPTH